MVANSNIVFFERNKDLLPSATQSNNNVINFYRYQQVEWSGVAGFDGPGSGSIEESGSITLTPSQEMVLTFIYYNTTSSFFPEKKYSSFVSDLKYIEDEALSKYISISVSEFDSPKLNTLILFV